MDRRRREVIVEAVLAGVMLAVSVTLLLYLRWKFHYPWWVNPVLAFGLGVGCGRWASYRRRRRVEREVDRDIARLRESNEWRMVTKTITQTTERMKPPEPPTPPSPPTTWH